MAGVYSVKDTMTKDVKIVGRDTNVQAVVNMMLEYGISSIVIVQNDRPVGIVTHRNILQGIVKTGLDPVAIKTSQIMTTPVITINENASLEEAAKLMNDRKVKKLPVVKNDRIVGIITSMDLVREHPNVVSLLEDICAPHSST